MAPGIVMSAKGWSLWKDPGCFWKLRKQVESAELKNQRLKEVFQTKIQEFRKACYTLTGYQIDITTENQYRLTSLYAEHQGDCLIFKVGPPRAGSLALWLSCLLWLGDLTVALSKGAASCLKAMVWWARWEGDALACPRHP
ncbi:Mitotic spindle assembly checkpoint protein MAD1 [Plecturocebus cupreus]